MHIHLLQLDIKWRDKAANFRRVEELVAQAATAPGDLIVLPEMFATGFDVEFGGLAEGSDGVLAETADFLADLARRTGCCVQGTGISRSSVSGKRQNLAVAYSPVGPEDPVGSDLRTGPACQEGPSGPDLGTGPTGPNGPAGSDGPHPTPLQHSTPLATFQKLHPFSFGGEHKRFDAGPGVVLYDWNGWRVAPLICYDLRFPEAFRRAVLQGATLFLVPANWPAVRRHHWLPLLQARAIENQAVVAGVNRCGSDQYLQYAGETVLYGPRGEQLGLLGTSEAVLSAALEAADVVAWRAQFPVLQDCRKDFFPDL